MTKGPSQLERHRQAKEIFRHRYESAYESGPVYEGLAQRWREITEFPLIMSVTPAGLVLDAGCGDCGLTKFLCTPSRRMIGVDFSCHALRAARRSFRSIEGGTIPELVLGDVDRLPFKKGCFDGTVCVGTLEYFDDLQAALGELARVTKTGGGLVLAVRNRIRMPKLGQRRGTQWAAISEMFACYDAKQVEKIVATAGGRNLRILAYFAISPAGLARRLAQLPRTLQRVGLLAFWLLERLATATGAGLRVSRALLISYTVR